MMAGRTHPITPMPDTVARVTTELRRFAVNPSDQGKYFLGLMSSATETAITGYENNDEASLRIGLRQQMSYIAAAVAANATDQS